MNFPSPYTSSCLGLRTFSLRDSESRMRLVSRTFTPPTSPVRETAAPLHPLLPGHPADPSPTRPPRIMIMQAKMRQPKENVHLYGENGLKFRSEKFFYFKPFISKMKIDMSCIEQPLIRYGGEEWMHNNKLPYINARSRIFFRRGEPSLDQSIKENIIWLIALIANYSNNFFASRKRIFRNPLPCRMHFPFLQIFLDQHIIAFKSGTSKSLYIIYWHSF